MPKEDVIAQIEAAFQETPLPGDGYDDITVVKYWDEGIVDYFRGTSWRGHHVQDLRNHGCALSYFTDNAFRYWLPAFMIAELEYPVEADVIAEVIASGLVDATRAEERLRQFTRDELEAVAAFLDECVQRYEDGSRYRQFRQAAITVRARIPKA